MVVFQNKIIYMPSMPPFTRKEKIAHYEQQCKPVEWREERIRSGDGVEIALAVGSVASQLVNVEERHVVVLYFQGNGSSLPPRLPGLSQVLVSLHASSSPKNCPSFTVIALSYRGFWTSKGRPSERGIALDADAAVAWASDNFPADSSLVLWGQSLGAGVAVAAAAAATRGRQHTSPGPSLQDTTKKVQKLEAQKLEVKGLLLETPFTSVKDMLAAIYPQTWLPYRYLWPFLRSHWNSRRALSHVAESGMKPQMLILQAGRDELVPQAHGEQLEEICVAGLIDVKRLVVDNALHHEVIAKPQGRSAVVTFLKDIGERR